MAIHSHVAKIAARMRSSEDVESLIQPPGSESGESSSVGREKQGTIKREPLLAVEIIDLTQRSHSPIFMGAYDGTLIDLTMD